MNEDQTRIMDLLRHEFPRLPEFALGTLALEILKVCRETEREGKTVDEQGREVPDLPTVRDREIAEGLQGGIQAPDDM